MLCCVVFMFFVVFCFVVFILCYCLNTHCSFCVDSWIPIHVLLVLVLKIIFVFLYFLPDFILCLPGGVHSATRAAKYEQVGFVARRI